MSDDRIEKAIEINAPAQKVWELIVIPGWYINDGEIRHHLIENHDDGLSIVHDPMHGRFPFRTIKLEPPRHAVFRWEPEPDPDEESSFAPGGATLVEFWIEDRSDGGVLLRVAESGFASLVHTEAEQRRMVEQSAEGWEVELEAAKTYLEG